MDELSIAKIDADMGDGDTAFFVGEEKEKISFFQVCQIDGFAFFRLCPCGAGKIDTVFFIEVLYISGAVETFGSGSSPDILTALEIASITQKVFSVFLGKTIGLALLCGSSTGFGDTFCRSFCRFCCTGEVLFTVKFVIDRL